MIIKVPSISPDNGYSIKIKSGLLSKAGEIIKNKTDGQIVVLTNKTVRNLWYKDLRDSFKSAGLKEKQIIIPDGERYKNNRVYNNIISEMLNCGANRYSTLVTFGGGVIGDIGGLVAATFMRGIKLIHIPTTLIAQIDSSIGGKVAVDHPRAKNIIGAFYNPVEVITDPKILSTLTKKEFINGLFEIIKVAMVRDMKFYDYIYKNIDKIFDRDQKTIEYLVVKAAGLKADIIKKDPFEKKLRMILNFGHTFGHALETSGAYKNVSHGTAVGWGMILALQLSRHYKYINIVKLKDWVGLIWKLIGQNKLPNLDPENIWRTMVLDKKAKNHKVRFVLLRGIGRPIIKEINKNDFIKSLGDI